MVRKGAVSVDDVAPPLVEPGTVLVRVQRSSVSPGTELSGIRSSGVPLWKRAMDDPAKVRRVIDVAASQGITAARDLVTNARSTATVTGYSAAGVVIGVGAGVTDFRVRDRVACAGAQAAHHAEVIRVPTNLVVHVPDEVSVADASTVTLGAIALQGVRRLEPTLGETFVVVGLGILGQLAVQMLRANGCRVIGLDLDAARVDLARDLGMEVGLVTADDDGLDDVARLTSGVGADGVVITASTPGSDVLSQAFRMTRRKGRVVLVGDVGLDIDRADIYEKELDFLISTSYGPGRYDRRYEEDGLDYPLAHVRWTENRNMQAYLGLVEHGSVRLGSLIGAVYPLDQADEAYRAARGGAAVLVQLEYPEKTASDQRVIEHVAPARVRDGAIGVAVVGAGAFATGVHLPNLRALGDDVSLEAVVGRSGPAAAEAATRFGARYSTTDLESILTDDAVELVVIATRHDSHAALAQQALNAGKHVLVEKPLALTPAELEGIESFYAEREADGSPILLTGFNRRFSSHAKRLRELVSSRSGPMMVQYRMNAGYIDPDHWTQTGAGGGRNLGEACHIYDLFTFLADTELAEVSAVGIHPASGYYLPTDNFVATVRFTDGSVCSLTYTAMGSEDVAKERMDVYVDGQVLELHDYRSLEVHGSQAAGLNTKTADKGHAAELSALVDAIRAAGPWPIPLWQQVQATRIALDVQSQIAGAADAPAD